MGWIRGTLSLQLLLETLLSPAPFPRKLIAQLHVPVGASTQGRIDDANAGHFGCSDPVVECMQIRSCSVPIHQPTPFELGGF